MTRRDNFPQSVKASLAARAGFKCSFPACTASTIGPSSESPDAKSISGEAAHIVAASDGPGARRVRNISAEERCSFENGIWMCARHARIIDRDETRFTIPMLQTWKKLAEYRTQLEHDLGRPIELSPQNTIHFDIIENVVDVTGLADCRITVGNAFADACVSQIWGRLVENAVRDSTIELAYNAFTHGKATCVRLTFGPRQIVLVDDGSPFNPLVNLPRQGRGGSDTINHLLQEFSESVFASYRQDGERNEVSFTFVRTADDIRALTPCFLNARDDEFDLNSYINCDRVFLILPRYMVSSEAIFLGMAIEELKGAGKDVVLVITDVSELVKERIRTLHPNLRILFASCDDLTDF